VDLSPVTRTLADGSIVAGMPDNGASTTTTTTHLPVGVAYPGPMGASERVVKLIDPEVRQLIDELVDEVLRLTQGLMAVLPEGHADKLFDLLTKSQQVLARD